jgi:hypothetical protein
VDLAELQQLCEKDLRGPLFDPPQTRQARPAKRPSMTMSVVGIVSEPGHSMAMLQKSDGTVVLCAEGETVEDAGGPVTVTKVEQQKVTVRYGGEVLDVDVQRPASPP